MKRLIVFMAAMAMIFSLSYAQKATSDIYGTVLLPDGSAIPGVAVTLTGDVIGKKTTVTSEEGNFRFLKLPPGNYELRFELEGFKTVIRKNIRMFVGKNVTLNVPMETTTIKEEIVITEKAGVIDTRKTSVGVNVSKEMIQSLPTSRNPWTVMNLVPGMMVDREDVGGNESGQQSSFYGGGASEDDSTWNVDGANITDPSAIGAAPAYLNVNAYEELQVTIGSTDITAQTGGVQLNFVSKRAGNRFSGDFHLYVEDEAWEMSQSLPQSILDEGWGSPGIFRLYQYGINFGGPIIKDKWWFYGSWSIQDIHSRTIVGDEDATWLVSAYGKTNFQAGNTSGEFHMSYDAKLKWGRTLISRAQQEEGTLFDQKGPGYIWMASLQHVMGNLMLNGKFAYTNGGFTLDPRGSDLDANNQNVGLDWLFHYSPRFYGGSAVHYYTDRNTINLSLDGNYFAENVLGGDHEIRFGVDYYTGDTTSTTLYPNQRIAFLSGTAYGDVSWGIWFLPDLYYDATFNRISFYLSDTATFGKLTASLGVRYDKESGKLNEAYQPPLTWHEPGNPHHGEVLFPSLGSGFTVQPGDSPQSYEVISPRLSLSYDITGDGKNVVKLTVARYGSQSGNNLTARYWPYREIDVYWYDDISAGGNGDRVPNWDELDSSWYDTNCNRIDFAGTGWRNNTTDPDFNSPLLDEVALTFERALGEDVAVSVTGTYKKRHNLVHTQGILSDSSLEGPTNWYYAGDYTFGDGSTAPYYQRYEQPVNFHFTNYGNGTYQTYMGVTIIFTKKFSNKWMLDASFTYADWKATWDRDEWGDIGDDDTTGDLTNYDYFNKGVVAPQSGGSGLAGIFVNARWMFKLSGLYQLPWGVNITGVLTAREGYVLPYHESLYRPLGLGWENIYKTGTKFGDDRLPTFWMLNLGLEKTFKISDTASATLFVDVYNVTNNTTTLLVETDYESDNFDQPLRILNPGIFQFGIRVNF